MRIQQTSTQQFTLGTEANLANVLIIKTVPLAITEGLDAGVVVATCSAPRMDHDGEQLKGQQTLTRKTDEKNLFTEQPSFVLLVHDNQC